MWVELRQELDRLEEMPALFGERQQSEVKPLPGKPEPGPDTEKQSSSIA